MEDEKLIQQLHEAEMALAEAEKAYGPDHAEVADKLLKYATLLRQTQKRTLDAVNIEARARAIRARIFAAEAGTQNAAPAVVVIRPQSNAPDPAMYLGLGGMLAALVALFISAKYFFVLAGLAVMLIIADVVLSKGKWWRALLTLLFMLTGWYSMQSLPSTMLPNASPIDRLNFANENAELVSKVRHLGKPTQALIYNLCLPEGFQLDEDTKKDWGHLVSWKGPARQDGGEPAKLVLMVVNPPNDVKKQFRSYSVTKGAKELVLPLIYDMFQVSETKQDNPQLEFVNGMNFVRIGVTAKPSDGPDVQKRAFVYATKESNRIVALVGFDSMPWAADSLEPMEASVLTLTQQGRESALEIE